MSALRLRALLIGGALVLAIVLAHPLGLYAQLIPDETIDTPSDGNEVASTSPEEIANATSTPEEGGDGVAEVPPVVDEAGSSTPTENSEEASPEPVMETPPAPVDIHIEEKLRIPRSRSVEETEVSGFIRNITGRQITIQTNDHLDPKSDDQDVDIFTISVTSRVVIRSRDGVGEFSNLVPGTHVIVQFGSAGRLATPVSIEYLHTQASIEPQ